MRNLQMLANANTSCVRAQDKVLKYWGCESCFRHSGIAVDGNLYRILNVVIGRLFMESGVT